MKNISIKNNSPRSCFQCGAELIFVSEETVQPEGSRFPQINTIYRCSNNECQKNKDKENKERLRVLEMRTQKTKERTGEQKSD